MYVPADAWVDLAERFVRARKTLPATEWVPSVDSSQAKMDGTEKQRIQIYLLVQYRQSESHNNAAVHRMLSGDGWPEMTPQEAFYLTRRLDHAVLFVGSLLTVDGDAIRTIIPFPSAPSTDVAHWILTEWWARTGLREHFDMATSDEAIFQQFFS